MLSTGFQTDWRHTVWAWWCLLLFFLETWRTSSSLIFSAGVGERGVAGGVNGWMRCSGRVLGVFKTAVELIQIVCQLLILHNAGGWRLSDLSTLKQNH